MDIDSILNGHGIGAGGSNIKSIQRGVLTTLVSVSNIEISSVDLTKSIVIVNTNTYQGGILDSDVAVKAILTSSTQLTLTTITNNFSGTIVSWTIIEFNNVKSLQTGSKSTSLASDTTTISAINVNKSILFYSWTSSGDTATQNIISNCYILDNTTITFKSTLAVAKVIAWQVIEFN